MPINDTVVFFSLAGRLNDIYHDYKYTYIACGIVLLIASVFLFVGMGINYHLLDKEKKEEERKAGLEDKDQETNIDNAVKEKDAENDVSTPLTQADVSKLDEDTV